MKIRSGEAIPVSVNFEGVMPGMHIVLRLQTDDGIEGVSYVSRVNSRNVKALKLLIEAMMETTLGMDADGHAVPLCASLQARAWRAGIGTRVARGQRHRGRRLGHQRQGTWATCVSVDGWNAGSRTDFRQLGAHARRCARDARRAHWQSARARVQSGQVSRWSRAARRRDRACPLRAPLRRAGREDHRRR